MTPTTWGSTVWVEIRKFLHFKSSFMTISKKLYELSGFFKYRFNKFIQSLPQMLGQYRTLYLLTCMSCLWLASKVLLQLFSLCAVGINPQSKVFPNISSCWISLNKIVFNVFLLFLIFLLLFGSLKTISKTSGFYHFYISLIITTPNHQVCYFLYFLFIPVCIINNILKNHLFYYYNFLWNCCWFTMIYYDLLWFTQVHFIFQVGNPFIFQYYWCVFENHL